MNPAAGILPLVAPPKFDRIDALKTVTYYKYATTLFDVVRRSMPYPMPKTLTNDELYALSAYILSLNKIIGANDVMDAKTLPQVKMPNRDNFIIWAPDKISHGTAAPFGPPPREGGACPGHRRLRVGWSGRAAMTRGTQRPLHPLPRQCDKFTITAHPRFEGSC